MHYRWYEKKSTEVLSNSLCSQLNEQVNAEGMRDSDQLKPPDRQLTL